MRLFDLSGKRALVIGASGGIGEAITSALYSTGATVIISARSEDEIRELKNFYQDEPRNIDGVSCDLSDDNQIRDLIRTVRDTFGPLDILVCNAGITGSPGPFENMEIENFDTVFRVNLRSSILVTQGLLPDMAATGGGSVILMASIAGVRGNSAINAYALSKAGVAQLARNLAVEWGPRKIRVNAVSPGLIRTPLAQPLLDDADFMRARVKMTPLRRIGEPDEIAGAVLFLASSGSGFVTGHNLVVDGGTTITDGS